jgi:hypothetical protein
LGAKRKLRVVDCDWPWALGSDVRRRNRRRRRKGRRWRKRGPHAEAIVVDRRRNCADQKF